MIVVPFFTVGTLLCRGTTRSSSFDRMRLFLDAFIGVLGTVFSFPLFCTFFGDGLHLTTQHDTNQRTLTQRVTGPQCSNALRDRLVATGIANPNGYIPVFIRGRRERDPQTKRAPPRVFGKVRVRGCIFPTENSR